MTPEPGVNSSNFSSFPENQTRDAGDSGTSGSPNGGPRAGASTAQGVMSGSGANQLGCEIPEPDQRIPGRRWRCRQAAPAGRFLFPRHIQLCRSRHRPRWQDAVGRYLGRPGPHGRYLPQVGCDWSAPANSRISDRRSIGQVRANQVGSASLSTIDLRGWPAEQGKGAFTIDHEITPFASRECSGPCAYSG